MARTTYIENLREGLKELLRTEVEAFLLGEDIAEPYGGAFKVTKGLSTEFPGRVIQTPMSEQGFVGMGMGMALAGMKPVVEIMFGDFSTLIVDQLVNHGAKFPWLYKTPMHIVIRTPMGGYRGYAATHSQSLERLFFGQPNIKVVAPSILQDPGRLLIHSLQQGLPVFFVENKLDYPRKMLEQTKNFQDLEIQRRGLEFPTAQVQVAGFEEPDLTIITYGGLVQMALDLQWKFMIEEEVAIKVVVPSQLSPLALNPILGFIRNDPQLLLLEEGVQPFGWTSELYVRLKENGFEGSVSRVGSKPLVIGAAQVLENHVLPGMDRLEETIRKRVEKHE
ncbi:MAG TPA: transketolase C-terminal domain-containing protein [Thermotogota bacterium]|nr:transketolase C-terminal domain-containing protein [Thermotogota bacterium]HRW93778.1 transketolase C-terminal domain-containing protein [Thermotogota bacterium]